MDRLIFPEWTEKFKRLVGLLVAGGPIYAIALIGYGVSPEAIRIGYQPVQPVPYSHALHAGELGIDCRYCHVGVERAAAASVPPASTCMNCHTLIRPDSDQLALVRAAAGGADGAGAADGAGEADSRSPGGSLAWVRVHDLPDYVYFNHSAHVTRGVGCESCHGRVDKMPEVYQAMPLTMEWCLDCHRNPEPHLRDPAAVTAMGYQPDGDRLAIGKALRDKHNINPPTNCSTCHR